MWLLKWFSSIVLTVDQKIWIWGAGVFGQLGNGRKDKSSSPLQVDLESEKISLISVGHFHTLALSDTGNVWLWGCSPQSLRIGTTSRRMNTAQTKSFESLPSENPQPIEQVLPKELHLSPRLVDVNNVIGKVVNISGGWNHSCVVDDRGHVYLWGLNLDGQLGTGDRKEVLNPRQLNLVIGKPKDDADGPLLYEINCISVACGGDFTFAVDIRGGIFKAGNRHDQNFVGPVRVLKMKSSNRIVRLPGHSPGDLTFVKWGHLNQFNTESQILGQSESIRLIDNPLRSVKSFSNFKWVDAIFSALEPWVKDEVLEASPFLTARMHLLRGNFEKSLRYQLDHFGTALVCEPLKYYAHLDSGTTEKVDIARGILSERIKDVCKSILNEETSKEFNRILYSSIKCLCDEETVELLSYNDNIYGRESSELTPSEVYTTWWCAAAGMLSIAPNPVALADVLVKWWHEKYSNNKDSFDEASVEVENFADNRDYEEKYKIERQYSKEDVEAMESALRGAGNDAAAKIALFSTVSAQFEGLLSPDFYLTQCDTLFEHW